MKSIAFFTSTVFIFVYATERKLAMSSPVNDDEDTSKNGKGEGNSESEGIAKTEESVPEESGEKIFLQLSDLKPYDYQLAGHRGQTTVENQIGLLIYVDPQGNLLKPYPDNREVAFYNALKTTRDDTLKEMKQFVPSYFGIKYVKIDSEDIKFIHIEDVLKNYEIVCSMDVKVGIQRRPPGAPPKTAEKQLRYRPMMLEHGFAIPGFVYYDIAKETSLRAGRELGHFMKPHQGIQVLYHFVNGEVGIRQCGLVSSILEQLQKIDSWFQRQRLYRFFDVSLLLTYDAKDLKACLEKKKSDGDIRSEDFKVQARVRMIDFAKGVPVSKIDFNKTDGDTADNEDRNFTIGLLKLIWILQNLETVYTDSMRDQQDDEK